DIVDGGADLADLLISFGGASSGVTVDFRALDGGGSLTIAGHSISNIRSVLWIEGSDFDDTITGSDQGDGSGTTYAPIFGMGGNDHLIAGINTGNIYGGAGNDLIDVHQSSTGIGYNGVYYGEDGNDVISLAGTAYGGAGDDTINIAESRTYQSAAYGEAGADTINGSSRDDEIDAGADDDMISGGGGADTMAGGAGNDIFKDTKAGLNGDTIADFGADDKIVFTDAALTEFAFSVSGNTLTYS